LLYPVELREVVCNLEALDILVKLFVATNVFTL